MIWDPETIFFWVVGFLALLLYLWAKYYSYDFDLKEPRGKAFTASLVCFALALVCGFEIVAGFVTPLEIQGVVSHVDLRNGGKGGDHSKFEVTCPSGRRVQIASAHNFVEDLSIGETLRVSYNPWTSYPNEVEKIDGAMGQLLLSNPQSHLVDWILLVVLAICGIYNCRKLVGT